MKTPQQLLESMHSLVTPAFSGTNEEMMAAIGYWVTLVSQLRSMEATITNFENKSAIIAQLEQEVAILKAELQNIGAVVQPGSIEMDQPIVPNNQNAPATPMGPPSTTGANPLSAPSVTLNTEALSRAAGIVKPATKGDLLETAFKGFKQ